MTCDLGLTPAGRLLLRESEADGAGPPDPWTKRVAAAFSSSSAAGLFALATTRPDAPPAPSISYWREFSCRYLTALCRTPESTGTKPAPLGPPADTDLASLLMSAPPMRGGEYLSIAVFHGLWTDLDAWVRAEVAASGGGLPAWLRAHAPLWHQVGRVCFHLAENKRDPEYPFAFLATYAPRLSKGGRVQYQPLGQALQEYAGERNKAALVNLLLPVHRASEKVAFVKKMVESG